MNRRCRPFRRQAIRPGIDRSTFAEARLIAGLTRRGAADLLRVTCRTVCNWERGRTAVPYSAFKLMRVMTGWELPDEAWRGWCVRGDTLWSPTGRGFEAGSLGYLALVFAMARHWLRDRGYTDALPSAERCSLPTTEPAAQAARRGARRGRCLAQRGCGLRQGKRRVSGSAAVVSRPSTPPITNRGGSGVPRSPSIVAISLEVQEHGGPFDLAASPVTQNSCQLSADDEEKEVIPGR